MFVVFAYDIPDSRRRLRVAKALQRVATRVQRSVFEGYLDRGTLGSTLVRLRKILDQKRDSVRIYIVCRTCLSQTVILGPGELTPEPRTIVL